MTILLHTVQSDTVTEHYCQWQLVIWEGVVSAHLKCPSAPASCKTHIKQSALIP